MKIIARGAGETLVAELSTAEFYHLLGARWSQDGDKMMREMGACNQYGEPRFVGASIDVTKRFMRTLALESRYNEMKPATTALRAMADLIDGLAKETLSFAKEDKTNG